jgi:outer membrane protein, adhesin transport system
MLPCAGRKPAHLLPVVLGLAFCGSASLASAQGLETLIAEVLASHPAAQSQRALVDSAQAGVGGARWQFFPTPSATVETARTRDSDRLYQGDHRVMTLRLQQPVWTGGRLTAGLEKAEATLSASENASEDSRQQLALRVVQAYGDWLGAHLKILAGEKNLATHGRLRDQVSRRIEEGAAAQSDLTLAVARYQSVVADVEAAIAQREVALARLGQLLGRVVSGNVMAQSASAPRAFSANPRELVEKAMAANPSLEKARAQARLQAAVVDERRADLAPEVYVRLERQVGNYNFANGPPENRLFLGINTRFGAGLSSVTGIAAARAQHLSAQAEIEVQSRALSEQVLADHALAIAAEQRLRALGASLEAAKEVALSYDRQYLSGRKSWLDVMNAARELVQTESQMAELFATQVVVTWRLAIVSSGLAEITAGVR